MPSHNSQFNLEELNHISKKHSHFNDHEVQSLIKDRAAVLLEYNTTDELIKIALDYERNIAHLAAKKVTSQRMDFYATEKTTLVDLLKKHAETFPNANDLLHLLESNFTNELDDNVCIKSFRAVKRYNNVLLLILKNNHTFAQYLRNDHGFIFKLSYEFPASTMVRLLSNREILNTLSSEEIGALALSSPEMAKAILQVDDVAILLSPMHIKELDRKYCSESNKDFGYDLYLMSRFQEELCQHIKGNAVILTDENEAYFVIDGKISREETKVQCVDIANRYIGYSWSKQPRKANGTEERIKQIIQEATSKGGHAKDFAVYYCLTEWQNKRKENIHTLSSLTLYDFILESDEDELLHDDIKELIERDDLTFFSTLELIKLFSYYGSNAGNLLSVLTYKLNDSFKLGVGDILRDFHVQRRKSQCIPGIVQLESDWKNACNDQAENIRKEDEFLFYFLDNISGTAINKLLDEVNKNFDKLELLNVVRVNLLKQIRKYFNGEVTLEELFNLRKSILNRTIKAFKSISSFVDNVYNTVIHPLEEQIRELNTTVADGNYENRDIRVLQLRTVINNIETTVRNAVANEISGQHKLDITRSSLVTNALASNINNKLHGLEKKAIIAGHHNLISDVIAYVAKIFIGIALSATGVGLAITIPLRYTFFGPKPMKTLEVVGQIKHNFIKSCMSL